MGAGRAVAVGDRAPALELPDQHGRTVRLADLRAPAVVLFFPYAFSPICTRELEAVRDDPVLADDGVEVLAVSCDSMFVLRHFSEALGVGHRLLSDFWPHGDVSRRWGVFDDEHGCAGRGTFVLDADGVVRWSVVNALPDSRQDGGYHDALARIRTGRADPARGGDGG